MATQFGFNLTFYSTFYNNSLLNFWPSASNGFQAIHAAGVGNASVQIHDNILVNAGWTAISASNSVSIHHNAIQNETNCLSIGSGTNVSVYSEDNTYILCGVQSAAWGASGATTIISRNDQFTTANATSLAAMRFLGTGANPIFTNLLLSASGTTGAAFQCGVGNTCTVDGQNNSIFNSSSGAAPGILNAGTMILQNTTVGSTNGTGVSNSGTLFVKSGNTFNNGITNTGVITGIDGQGVYQGSCTGVVTSAATVGLYNLGQTAATTCTSTTVGSGRVMSQAGKIYALYCTATAGNQATDACKVVLNGVAQTMTCSLNAVASCTDGAVAHVITYAQGDIVGVEVIAGTATTLANVKGLIVTN
jgi:hypothetical protein